MGDASTVLNLAAWQARSLSNGPGCRYVLWLQGCFRKCPGCVNAPMQPHVIRHVRGVDEVAAAILAAPDIEGVTYSGGEPLEQLKPLVVLSRRLRQAGLSIVCYTGYTLQELQRSGHRDVSELLDCVDILIDGPFLRDQAACLLWRGSRNQQVHFLTERYRAWSASVEVAAAQVEMRLGDGCLVTSGNWPDGFVEELELALRQPDLA